MTTTTRTTYQARLLKAPISFGGMQSKELAECKAAIARLRESGKITVQASLHPTLAANKDFGRKASHR